MRRSNTTFVAGLLMSALALLGAKPPSEPISEVDRTWVVGKPPLDRDPKAGFYVWVASKKFEVAAVGRKDKVEIFQIHISSTKPLEMKESSDCRLVNKKTHSMILAYKPRGPIAQCSFETEGNVTLRKAYANTKPVSIYLGPTTKKANRKVNIVRRFE